MVDKFIFILLLNVLFNTSYCQSNYVTSQTALNFTSAEQYCITRGTHLASIHSETDNSDALSLCQVVSFIDPCFIGLQTLNGGNTLEWTDNTALDYGSTLQQHPWNFVEPDFTSGNCIGITTMGWEATDCTKSYYFLCDVSNTPQPTTPPTTMTQTTSLPTDAQQTPLPTPLPSSILTPLPTGMTQTTLLPTVTLQTNLPTTSVQTPLPTVSTQTDLPTTSIQTPLPTVTAQTPLPTVTAQTALPTTSVQTPLPTITEQTASPTTSIQTPLPTVTVTTKSPTSPASPTSPNPTLNPSTSTTKTSSPTPSPSEKTGEIESYPICCDNAWNGIYKSSYTSIKMAFTAPDNIETVTFSTVNEFTDIQATLTLNDIAEGTQIKQCDDGCSINYPDIDSSPHFYQLVITTNDELKSAQLYRYYLHVNCTYRTPSPTKEPTTSPTTPMPTTPMPTFNPITPMPTPPPQTRMPTPPPVPTTPMPSLSPITPTTSMPTPPPQPTTPMPTFSPQTPFPTRSPVPPTASKPTTPMPTFPPQTQFPTRSPVPPTTPKPTTPQTQFPTGSPVPPTTPQPTTPFPTFSPITPFPTMPPTMYKPPVCMGEYSAIIGIRNPFNAFSSAQCRNMSLVDACDIYCNFGYFATQKNGGISISSMPRSGSLCSCDDIGSGGLFYEDEGNVIYINPSNPFNMKYFSFSVDNDVIVKKSVPAPTLPPLPFSRRRLANIDSTCSYIIDPVYNTQTYSGTFPIGINACFPSSKTANFQTSYSGFNFQCISNKVYMNYYESTFLSSFAVCATQPTNTIEVTSTNGGYYCATKDVVNTTCEYLSGVSYPTNDCSTSTTFGQDYTEMEFLIDSMTTCQKWGNYYASATCDGGMGTLTFYNNAQCSHADTTINSFDLFTGTSFTLGTNSYCFQQGICYKPPPPTFEPTYNPTTTTIPTAPTTIDLPTASPTTAFIFPTEPTVSVPTTPTTPTIPTMPPFPTYPTFPSFQIPTATPAPTLKPKLKNCTTSYSLIDGYFMGLTAGINENNQMTFRRNQTSKLNRQESTSRRRILASDSGSCSFDENNQNENCLNYCTMELSISIEKDILMIKNISNDESKCNKCPYGTGIFDTLTNSFYGYFEDGTMFNISNDSYQNDNDENIFMVSLLPYYNTENNWCQMEFSLDYGCFMNIGDNCPSNSMFTTTEVTPSPTDGSNNGSGDKKQGSMIGIIIAIIATGVFVLLIVLVGYYFWKRKQSVDTTEYQLMNEDTKINTL